MKTIVGYLDRLRHNVDAVTIDPYDNKLVTTQCELKLVLVVRGKACRYSLQGHRIAMPGCRWHLPLTTCTKCRAKGEALSIPIPS